MRSKLIRRRFLIGIGELWWILGARIGGSWWTLKRSRHELFSQRYGADFDGISIWRLFGFTLTRRTR